MKELYLKSFVSVLNWITNVTSDLIKTKTTNVSQKNQYLTKFRKIVKVLMKSL